MCCRLVYFGFWLVDKLLGRLQIWLVLFVFCCCFSYFIYLDGLVCFVYIVFVLFVFSVFCRVVYVMYFFVSCVCFTLFWCFISVCLVSLYCWLVSLISFIRLLWSLWIHNLLHSGSIQLPVVLFIVYSFYSWHKRMRYFEW